MNLQRQIIKRSTQLISFFLGIEILLGYKLWFPIYREFPLLSAFSWLDFSFGILGDGLLTLLVLIALVAIFLDWHKKLALATLLGCLTILILEDITRLQPWVYTQVALLILLCFNKKGQVKSVLTSVLWLIALVYIWSGIQKLNLGFLQETFPWLLTAFGFNLKTDTSAAMHTFNYVFAVVPLLECLIGVGLLSTKTRKTSIILALLMHVYIILSLGPTGLNWNLIILPWNLCFALLLLQFYALKEPLLITKDMSWFAFNYAVILFFGLLPALNFIGYWDSNLSSTMYSGTHSNVIFYFETDSTPQQTTFRAAATLPVEGKKQASLISETWLTSWSVYDLKVPFYSADRYYKRYGKQLCETTKNTSKAGIKIITRSKFTAKPVVTKCSCLTLLESNYFKLLSTK